MTSFFIKIIAIISMTVDHTAAVIGQMGILSIFPSLTLVSSSHIIKFMRGLGRIAFPLFAFQISESARKTRCMPKYIGRLAIFALISEPFFYFSLSLDSPSVSGFLRNISTLNFNNVFFTLMFSVIALYSYQRLSSNPKKRFLYIPILITCIFICGYIGSDYGMSGVILIFSLYLSKTKLQTCLIIVIWSFLVYAIPEFSANSLINCLFAISSCSIICSYNGKKGISARWLFYIYYPTHLLILSFIDKTITTAI